MRRYIIGICFLVLGCTKERSVQLQLPEHSPFSSQERWAVIREPYVRLNSTLEVSAEIIGVLRAGEVVQLLEVRSVYQNRERFWRDYYFVSTVDTEKHLEGWVSSDLVEVFLYEEGAKRNSERIRQRTEVNPH
ncbi:SH3 domain-containing protein [Entomospira entomophila]|uniref:SH3 domain-containing protein n=1 Tax=Entomospira entomophila TaxID=2719988 RepID=A0A968G9G3_9SPIO|nr:SH3 domain-containing protein [Entomospira entomophilus]NIZ40270.1 SH3 domain-containing protein [Entomospira entomophilus]WDI35829.1 SH3 domain-containing protein [Entomospira entomophilus]